MRDSISVEEAGKNMCEYAEGKEKDTRIGFEIRTIHNMIGVHVEHHMKSKGHDLTQMQSWVIGYLYSRKGQDTYQRDIEEEFHVSRATATNILKIMERKELIERKSVDTDKRLKKIYLTKQAVAIQKDAIEDMEFVEQMLVQGFSEEEITFFKRMLGVVHENVARDIHKTKFTKN
ncbi:MAG: MarR family transcriptional regulator [Lachnospiraceae bacterium]|nr:MarR family transcriptional regulator [Lachnospiraceae bacterium]